MNIIILSVSKVVLLLKNPPGNAGNVRDVGSIPGSGRSPGGGNGNPLSNVARRIPWTEEPGGLQSTGLHRVRQGRSDSAYMHVMFPGLSQWLSRELLDVQAGFRKGRGTRDQIANICWIMEKQENSRKTSISALLTMPKPLTVWITINCGKF